ncbi:hydroxyethylthiazole kinase [Virgibacillus soli]|uniref:Hydroxyethylthiazole kinase n=1 Tax=Paracerasibacillus soli TaxID=480284 RepID=A0ABU5CVB8_9BACI|nr:hydroxyethylthiazole kinase [Virgibacillus soli]MDY0410266.1 hydroxyethylthiazole kinase [Virgibacillus soli]
MNQAIIHQVREKNPLIHHLTNEVTMNFVADGLLSFGGSPVMAKALEEVDEMTSHSNGVFINIGTPTEKDLPAMIAAGKTANKYGIPVVIDPVGIAATSYRANYIHQVLSKVKPTVIKGNAGEIAYLADTPWEVKGVDSLGDESAIDIARKVANKYETAVVVTGKTDIICTKNKVSENITGHPYLTKVTGGGCLLGSVITACLATEASIDDQLLTAVSFYGLAANYATSLQQVTGPGSFKSAFIDALSYDINKLKG